MATITYYEDDHFPPNGDGLADVKKPYLNIEVIETSAYGNHQIFLRLTDPSGNYSSYHFTKEQARQIAAAFSEAESRIGYDNTKPGYPEER